MVSTNRDRKFNITLRAYLALTLVGCVCSILILRLWYLQIVNGAFYRERSENNLYRTVFVRPPRGFIFDRSGKILARNRPSYDVEITTADSPDPVESVTRLAKILDLDADSLIQKLKDHRSRARFEPKLLLKDVPRDVVAKVQSNQFFLPGVNVQIVPAREYVFGSLGAHVLGYLRQITRTQLESPTYSGYKLSDIVGQYGVETQWEHELQGMRGRRLVTVNANGIRIGEKSYEQERQGHNLTLTLSLPVQQAAETALSDVAGGAIVALDPRTGEILALASSPAFDPNQFIAGLNPEQWKDLTSGKGRKLTNRAIQGAYPAGSTFKILTAVAGLAEGEVKASTRINCPGHYFYAGRRYHCHKRTGHGGMNLREAIKKSCNVYFYTLGQRLGISKIAAYGEKFGLGRLTGIDLPHENPGTLPSPTWKRRYFRKPSDQIWYAGETLSVAIGQGALTVTPLQLALAYGAIANGGTLYKPTLIKEIRSQTGEFLDQGFGPQVQGQLAVSKDVLAEVIEAMTAVVEEPGGTGSRSKLELPEPIKVAGKTGTAQLAGLQRAQGVEELKDHGWFVAFAPAESAEIVVAAIIEHGGGGGLAAAPRVKQVMEAYFRDTRKYPTVEMPPTPAPKVAEPAETALPDLKNSPSSIQSSREQDLFDSEPLPQEKTELPSDSPPTSTDKTQ